VIGAWARRGGPPLVLGHRGARREAPENTLRAFERAAELGAAGVELDVRLDGDGDVVVFHDRTLERMTDGEDDRELESLTRGDRARVRLRGEPIPTLADALAWANDGGHHVNVEIKRDVSSRRALTWRVAKLVRSAKQRVLISSFDPAIVRAASLLCPGVPVAWLVHAKQRLLKSAPAWKRLGAVGVNPELALCEERRIRRWKSDGALVCVWTVNEAPDAVRLAELGVDAIISDVPGEIVKAI